MMADDIQEIEKLSFERDGFVYLRPCLDLVLYWTGSIWDRREAVVSFYERSLDLIRKDVKFFRSETMKAAAPLKKDSLGLVPFWLKKTAKKRDIYMMFLESGSVRDEPSDHAFALNATPECGYARLILPPSFIAKSVSPFVDLAVTLAQGFPFAFGQGGWAMNFNPLEMDYKRDALRSMNALAKRYPGIDMSHPFTTKYAPARGNGIKCINWLTMLNTEFVERLGGMARLRKAFDDKVVIHDLKSGVLIQAGPAPAIGDVNRRQALPAYRQVGRVLAPIRAEEQASIFGPAGVGDEDVTGKWLRRFDK
jgi:hypothetical protein